MIRIIFDSFILCFLHFSYFLFLVPFYHYPFYPFLYSLFYFPFIFFRFSFFLYSFFLYFVFRFTFFLFTIFFLFISFSLFSWFLSVWHFHIQHLTQEMLPRNNPLLDSQYKRMKRNTENKKQNKNHTWFWSMATIGHEVFCFNFIFIYF